MGCLAGRELPAIVFGQRQVRAAERGERAGGWRVRVHLWLRRRRVPGASCVERMFVFAVEHVLGCCE